MNYAIIAAKMKTASRKINISFFENNHRAYYARWFAYLFKTLTSQNTLYIILKYCKKEVPIWQKCGQALPTVLPTV